MITEPETIPSQTSPRRWLRAISQNPIALKELRSRMRGRRAFVVLTVYLTLMSGFISLVYLAYASAANGPYGPDPRQAGKVVFSAVLGVQGFLVVLVGPAFTAGAISGEKERQTYDLLRTTLLTARSFVLGKLVSALSYVLLLIFASVPLQSIAFLLGGVSVIELLLSQLLIVVAAITFAMFGLLCSSLMRSTLSASVTTFAGSLFITLGAPIIVLIFSGFIGPIVFGTASIGWVGEVALVYAGLALASFNLPATLIISELFLLEYDALFFAKETFSSQTVWLFSPWMSFLVVYTLLAWLFFWLCTRRIQRIATK